MVNQKYYPLFNTQSTPVLCVENYFSNDELEKFKQQLTLVKTDPALIGGVDITPENYYDVEVETHKIRKSNICFLTDSEFNWVYDKLIIAIKHVNSTNYNKTLYGVEPLQYSEYDSNYRGFYGVHVDDNVNDVISGMNRKLSFTLQLSKEDEYTGGDVIIHSNNIIASRSYGSITFFDSLIPHEVTPVTSGFRKSLVGWVLGPRV